MPLAAGSRLGPYEILKRSHAPAPAARVVSLGYFAKLRRAGITFIRAPHFARDGASYAYSYSRLLSELYLVKGLQ
jgi:hypothetical protein